MSESVFKDRVRERDLDNFLMEELHASDEFRRWVMARFEGRLHLPDGCEVRLQKSPPRHQDARQTDVRVGWFDTAGVLRACVLIESKVTADFQPGQAEAYLAEVEAARGELGPRRAVSLLIAPARKLAALPDAASFDACVSIEEIADFLTARRDGALTRELDARMAIRVELLEALCGKRSAAAWIGGTVPEKRGFAEAYAALAALMLPKLRVRPSSDGPKALTRIFEGLALPGLPTPTLRHEFGSGAAWKYVNAQFAGLADKAGALSASGLLIGTALSAESAGKSLAIRAPSPGINPTAAFAEQRDAVIAGLEALDALVVWLEANASAVAEILAPSGVAAPVAPGAASLGMPGPADPRALDREFAEALRAIYVESEKIGYRPTAMLEMIGRWGGIETARRLIASGPSDGFAKLALLGRLDLSVEQLILEPRWDGIFTEDERRTARRRLR